MSSLKSQPKKRKDKIALLNAYLDNQGKFSILVLGNRGTGKKHWIRKKYKQQKEVKIIQINATNSEPSREFWTQQFELANKGTLFLDEIAEMDMNIQAKLLRAIQEREVMRVGGEQAIKFDARIITATHRDLAEEVRNGNFREDLYYRLLGLKIELPPLRDRGNDIILLAQHFLNDFAKQNPVSYTHLTLPTTPYV